MRYLQLGKSRRLFIRNRFFILRRRKSKKAVQHFSVIRLEFGALEFILLVEVKYSVNKLKHSLPPKRRFNTCASLGNTSPPPALSFTTPTRKGARFQSASKTSIETDSNKHYLMASSVRASHEFS